MKLFFHTLSETSRTVNLILKRYISSYNNTALLQAIKYSTLSGGKKLRAFLVYQVGKIFGYSISNLHVPAIAIECIHSYSLIHDDLPMMDNGNVRRGKPSCHIKFGEETAILAGNSLHALAFEILSNGNMPDISRKDRLKMIFYLSNAIGMNELCLGQWLDLNVGMSKEEISERTIEMIHKKKTVSLILAAIKMSSLSIRKNKRIMQFLYGYAISVGLALQIKDDILDVHEDSKTKHYNNLHILRKNNYSIIFGLKNAKKKIKNLYIKSMFYLNKIEKFGYDTFMLKKLMDYIIKRNK